MQRVKCPTCASEVEPVTPRATKLVNGFMWVCGLTLAVAASIPLLGLAVLPLWFLALWGVGVSAARFSIATCPVCHAAIARPLAEPPTLRGPLAPQPTPAT
jgi:hypothetical protein